MNTNIFVNGLEICKFKGKDSETNADPLSLGNVTFSSLYKFIVLVQGPV